VVCEAGGEAAAGGETVAEEIPRGESADIEATEARLLDVAGETAEGSCGGGSMS